MGVVKPFKDPKAVPLDKMKDFFATRNRYILKLPNVDMGKLVTDLLLLLTAVTLLSLHLLSQLVVPSVQTEQSGLHQLYRHVQKPL